uniref:BTB domain-containing protein n=1 Tax=Steinernema glaseri TaxID=37863 RepID=A0A1I7Y095_9BILA
MDSVSPVFIEKLLQRGSFASICEATKLSGIYGEIARQFHQRSFNLFVYAKSPMNKKKPFAIRQTPTFNDPWSCCCEKKPEAYHYGTQFPKCVDDNMKYFRSIRVIVDARDVVQVALKPSFLPSFKRLLKDPFARVIAEEHYAEIEPFFVDHLLLPYYQELRTVDILYEIRHLLHSAFIDEKFTELLYRFKVSDDMKFMKKLVRQQDFKVYMQNTSPDGGMAVIVGQAYYDWYRSDKPLYGKYMVNGGDIMTVCEEVQKEKEEDCWIRLEHLPVHLIPYTKDDRYPLYQMYAEKHYFMRVHPKNPERKLYVALGVYEEAQTEYNELREWRPNEHPAVKPLVFCMQSCETYFIFFE